MPWNKDNRLLTPPSDWDGGTNNEPDSQACNPITLRNWGRRTLGQYNLLPKNVLDSTPPNCRLEVIAKRSPAQDNVSSDRNSCSVPRMMRERGERSRSGALNGARASVRACYPGCSCFVCMNMSPFASLYIHITNTSLQAREDKTLLRNRRRGGGCRSWAESPGSEESLRYPERKLPRRDKVRGRTARFEAPPSDPPAKGP